MRSSLRRIVTALFVASIACPPASALDPQRARDGAELVIVASYEDASGLKIFFDAETGEVFDVAYGVCGAWEQDYCRDKCVQKGPPVGPAKGRWVMVAVGCARVYDNLPESTQYHPACKCYWEDQSDPNECNVCY